jgi:hypothetical protein
VDQREEIVETLHDAQLHWQENGLYDNFTIEEAQCFNEFVEERERRLNKGFVTHGDTMVWR